MGKNMGNLAICGCRVQLCASVPHASLSMNHELRTLVFLVQENLFNAAEVGFSGGGSSDG
jgi:hypothetical protein